MFLYEFLYRGRAPDDPLAPAYHVQLGEVSTDAFGRTTCVISDALTPEQADALGFDLPEIVAAINAEMIAENQLLKEELAVLKKDAVEEIPIEVGVL